MTTQLGPERQPELAQPDSANAPPSTPEITPGDQIHSETSTAEDNKTTVSLSPDNLQKEPDNDISSAPDTLPIRDNTSRSTLSSVPQTAELPQTGRLSPRVFDKPSDTKKIRAFDLAESYQISAPEAITPGRGLVLFLPNDTVPIIFNDKELITLGRTDKAANIVPELDLTDHHGAELGVSRFHAVITRINNSYHIKDMGSTNGTWLNTKKIPPYRLTPIRSGDQIRLGHLNIIVG